MTDFQEQPAAGAGSDPVEQAEPVGWADRQVSTRRAAVLDTALARLATLSLRLLLVAAALWGAIWLLGKVWVVVQPALLGLLLASILWPITRLLRRRLPPALAAAIVLLTAVLLLLGMGAALAPQVTDQTQELADQVTAGLDEVRERLAGPPFNLGEERLGGAVDNVIAELQANAQTVAGRVVGGAAAAGSAAITGLLAVVLCFFYLKDGPKFLPWVSGLVGVRASEHVSELGRRTWVTLSDFIRAQAAVGLVDAVFIGLGLVVLGIPLALPLAVLVFFGAFIPIIGAVVTGALAALVALVSDGPTDALIVLAIVLIVQQLEGNVLQPILVGRSLDLHPALVILAVTAGGTLYGVVGAFFSVPVTATAAVCVRYARQQLAEVEPGPDSPPKPAGQPAVPEALSKQA